MKIDKLAAAIDAQYSRDDWPSVEDVAPSCAFKRSEALASLIRCQHAAPHRAGAHLMGAFLLGYHAHAADQFERMFSTETLHDDDPDQMLAESES